MPAYIQDPLQGVPPSLLSGVPGYSLGSFNDRLPAARLLVTSVAITGNVATLGVAMVEGNIPAIGSLISVQGTQTTTSGGAPNFNVTNAALTAVSINSTTGVGTVSFALTSSNIATTPDAGEAAVPVPIVPEAAAVKKGLQFGVPATTPTNQQGKNISWFYEFPSAPVSATIQLQGADVDQDAFYVMIDQQATIVATGETRAINNPLNFRFLRIAITAISGGTNPTVAAGIVI